MSGRRSIGMPLLTAVLVAVSFALFPALPVLAGGESRWPSQGGSSWAEEVDDAAPVPDAAPEDSRELLDLLATLTPPVVAPDPPAVQAVLTPAIAFPVAGPADYTNSFGAPRPEGRTHEGIDIFAEKMTPVIAVADGTVSLIRGGVGTDCCSLRIHHDDGQSSLYLHLNNDTPGTDDGQGYGIAEGIAVGTRVTAGTVVGYVGDSGNAEETPSHLHIELNDQSGLLLNPYAYLQVAQGAEPALFASALAAAPETLPATGLPAAGLLRSSLVLLLFGAALVGQGRRKELT
ncbi:MAG: M23 family metallopeptidase [Acidimicrobiia bacterium]|nr:M23 family metallopeptidase [Acidimicrobiia bacterium]